MERLKVATNSQEIAKSLIIDLHDTGNIQWNIRFNLPLCKNSINNNTVKILDNQGKKVLCDVEYKPKTQTITIYPIDLFECKKYYTLVITRQVQTAKQNRLKKEFRLAFMLNK